MEGPRAPTSQEFTDVVSFLNSNLRNHSNWSIAEEYPTAVTLQNLHNLRIIKDEKDILSHAVVKPTIMKTRRGLFKVGCIGSVVTHANFRNQGLSQNVLQECLKLCEQQGCDFAILWSDLYDFYKKLGFELAGSEISMLINKPLVSKDPNLNPSSQSYRVLQNNKIDVQALFRLYSQHTVSSIRNLDEFEKFLKIPNSRLYTAWSAEGNLEAYAVEGKGSDLQGYVHEWGGNVDALAYLFNHMSSSTHTPITVICPTHSQNLINRLESLGAQRVNGFLGLIKIINPQAFFSKIIRNVRQEWGVDHFTLEFKNGFYYYGVGQNIFKTDQESDIVRLLFGPVKPSKLCDAGPVANAILDKIFPIEMWIWGWDSV